MSNVGRYTSAELSRELRDAGLSQDTDPAAVHYHDAMGNIPAETDACSDEECWQFRDCVRAIRLDEALEELTQKHDDRQPYVTLTQVDCGWVCAHASTMDISEDGDTHVEAAGRCLLALLRERRGA